MSLYRLGIFGLREAGKTVACSTLYLVESESNDVNGSQNHPLVLTPVGEETIRYLTPLGEALAQGRKPVATSHPEKLRWQAGIGAARYDLECIDFPGELLEVLTKEGDLKGADGITPLRVEVRRWFAKCDAILLLIDSAAPGTPRYRDALVHLLEEMANCTSVHGSFQRAIAVVFTKADEVAADPRALANEDESRRLLEDHPLYAIVRDRLTRAEVEYRVFLTSALGWHFISVKEPERRIVRPCNLFAPVRWALERAIVLVESAQHELVEELQDDIQVRTRDERAWPFIRYKRLLAMVDAAERQFQLSSGPAAPQFKALRIGLRRKQKRQRTARIGLCALVVAFAVLYLHQLGQGVRNRVYDEFERLENEFPNDDGVRKRIAYFDANIANSDWDWFWGTDSRREKAFARLNEDRRELPRVLAREAYSAWVYMDGDLEKKNKPAHRFVAARRFLMEHGSAANDDNRNAAEAVTVLTLAAFKQDANEYHQVESIPASNERQWAEKAYRLTEYASRPDAAHSAKALALAKQTLLDWDSHEYQELLNLRQRSMTAGSIDTLALAAAAYLRAGRHTCSMGSPVKKLLREINELRSGKDYAVTVRRVHIPAGSDLWAERFGHPNCSVQIKIGNTVYATKKVKPPKKDPDNGFTVEMNQTLRSYRVVWGKNEPVSVLVTTHRSIQSNDVASTSFQLDGRGMSVFNGTLAVTCAKQKTIEITVECPAALLSPLPSFTSH